MKRQRSIRIAYRVTVFAVRLCLQAVKYQTLVSTLETVLPKSWRKIDSSGRALGSTFAQLNDRIPSSTCLHRSIAAWLILRIVGYSARIVIGVGKVNNSYKFHAWVEVEGEVLNESSADVTFRYFMATGA